MNRFEMTLLEGHIGVSLIEYDCHFDRYCFGLFSSNSGSLTGGAIMVNKSTPTCRYHVGGHFAISCICII